VRGKKPWLLNKGTNQLVNKAFKEKGQSTIGVEFKSFVIQTEGENVKLQICDTARQEPLMSYAFG
jgi:GTPase SAR1 family protein